MSYEKTIADLNALADRIDHEQLWRRPALQAIEAAPDMTNEAKDEAKAWTCATHVLLSSEVDTFFDGGFLHDKSDAAFNERMARSFMDAELPEPHLQPPKE
jgi:hypothetical protein